MIIIMGCGHACPVHVCLLGIKVLFGKLSFWERTKLREPCSSDSVL